MNWSKAMPGRWFRNLLETYVLAYLGQVAAFVDGDRGREWSLRAGTAGSAVRDHVRGLMPPAVSE